MVWAGFRQLAPISIFVTLFGAAFGLAAVQTGLDNSVILTMSALVFAGASQFAALELWGTQVPLFTLMVTVFRSEEHTSELQSLMRISYAVFCLKTKKQQHSIIYHHNTDTNKIYNSQCCTRTQT